MVLAFVGGRFGHVAGHGLHIRAVPTPLALRAGVCPWQETVSVAVVAAVVSGAVGTPSTLGARRL